MTKIAVLIPSRNRPRMLSAVITALHEMESGENEIRYLVGADHDDGETQHTAIQLMDIGVDAFDCPEKCITIGSIWNYLASNHVADIYSCMIDDAFPITPHWDKVMAQMAKQYEAFSWYEVSAPNNIGYPTCTKAWLERVGRISDEHYPYWFFDTVFAELVWFITNNPVPVSTSLALYSKQEATQNLRDLQFWWDFFKATRPLRVLEAHKIAGEGMSLEDFTTSRGKFIMLGEQRDAEFKGARIASIEAKKGVLGEPSDKYVSAKVAAEKFLADHNLSI